MMEIFLTVFFYTYILWGMLCSIYYVLALRFITQRKLGARFEQNRMRLALLCPALREEKGINQFLEHLDKTLSQDIDVYVITSQREYESLKENNTIDKVREFLAERNPKRIHHLHFPNAAGLKTDQLNYAVSVLSERDLSYDLIMNIDTDSRIDTSFYDALSAVYDVHVSAYQKPVSWTKGFCNYPRSLNGGLMKSFCMLQTFHSFSNEIPMLNDWPTIWRLKYLVGNGMCIKPDVLKNIGGFPEMIDDTRLGHILSFKGYRTRIIPAPGVVEGPKNLNIQIKQSSVWFFGCSLIHEDYKNAANKKWPTILKAFSGYHQQLAWLVRGSGMLICFVISCFYSSSLSILGLSAWLINSSFVVGLVYSSINTILTSFDHESKIHWSLSELMILMLLSPLMYVAGALGTSLGLYRVLKYIATRRVYLPKTER